MKNKLTLLVLLVTQLAFAGGKGVPAPEPEPEKPPVIVMPEKGILFDPIDYYSTPKEREVIRKASVLVNEVMHSQCATDFLLARKLIQTDGRTNEEVVKHLQSLNDLVPVRMYYRKWGKAVAYRDPPSKQINLNQKAFWPGLPLCDWAATLAHEGYGHSIGEYGHDFNWNAQRDFSVPYSIGGSAFKNKDVFQVCCKEPEK